MTNSHSSEVASRHRLRETGDRTSGSIGTYFISQYTIKLGWEAGDYIDESGHARPGQDLPRTAVFLHEYTHYLHNISTLVGIEQSVSLTALLGIYAKTLFAKKDGTSVGHSFLSADEKAYHLKVIGGFDHFVRSHNAGDESQHWSRTFKMAVRSWTRERITGDVALVRARLSVDMYDNENRGKTRDIYLDTQIIEEGIAYVLESLFMEEHNSTPMDAQFFPYRILSSVVRHYVPTAWPLDIIRIGLIAMNTTNSGVWLMDTLTSDGAAEIVHRSAELPDLLGWRVVFAKAKRNLLAKLSALRNSFRGRGVLGMGFESVVETATAQLARREADAFFDVPNNGGLVDWSKLFANTLRAVPCEVLVERDTNRDQLFTFGTEKPARIDGRRALDLSIEALKAHLGAGGVILPSEKARPRTCRYINWCPHPSRTETPEICRSEPWRYGNNRQSYRCLYAQGMLGLIANITQKPNKR